MINISTEELAPLTQALNRWIPTRPHVSTGWRWVSRGIRGHRLEIMKIGGKTYTSKQAIDRFLAAINGGAVTPTRVEREREISAAEARLEAAGV